MKLDYMPKGISWPLASLIALFVAGCSDGGDAGSAESASSAAGGPGGAGAVSAGSGAGDGGGGGVTTGAGAGPGGSTTTSTTSASSGEPGDTTTGATTTTTAAAGGEPEVSCDYPAEYANGSVTFYTLDMGSTEVNCSYPIVGRNPDVVGHVPFGGGQYFAAMNTADYNAAAMCGACVEVSRDDGRKKVQAMVVDQCPIGTNPKCTAGHIDLSKNAFLQIGEEREGYLGTTHGGAAGKISWRYIPCPTTGAVSFRLKEPTNKNWNQILVEGHAHPIEKLEVEINGTWKTATREPYNYFVVGDGNMGNAPYHVRATDINGSIVEAKLELKAGNQPASAQFPACN
ncbi:expansin EXLX1 family cellulose-binding protein [Sorangium sp. So ce375]|uniref:expansin EXLX1 family cellulose-binding protein n=1 Tax=Sorangium sp. So ce375 TaxID=3133306 RepID=UPI003F5B7C90